MPKLEAVIEIGSTESRLLVAEIREDGSWSVVDRAGLPNRVGRDVFTSGSISRESLLQCLAILERFCEQLRAWDIPREAIHCIATSAFREADNRDTVLDRIFTKTGCRVRVIDGIEENRLMYYSVASCLKACGNGKLLAENSIILDVGGGSTELMLLEKGRMAAAHSFRIGTVIVEQKLRDLAGDMRFIRRVLADFAANTRANLNAELRLSRIQLFIAAGADARIASEAAGESLSPQVRTMTRGAFEGFVAEALELSAGECAARYKIPAPDAEALRINLLCNLFFLQLTAAHTVLAPSANIREGLILSLLGPGSTAARDEFYAQVIASARNLARKYHCDEQHLEHVRAAAVRLFDALQAEHALGSRERMLLEAAAVLHDIGMFIQDTGHEAHSRYIIIHSEIFGLSADDVEIVSRVALLHRGRVHSRAEAEAGFRPLPRRNDRVVILKLASLLRIADALDRGHVQEVGDFSLDITNDAVIIRAAERRGNLLEKTALAEKADLFESVFGYRVYLE